MVSDQRNYYSNSQPMYPAGFQQDGSLDDLAQHGTSGLYQGHFLQQPMDSPIDSSMDYNFYNQMKLGASKSIRYDYAVILLLVLVIFILAIYYFNTKIHSKRVYVDMSKSSSSLLLSKEEIFSNYSSWFKQFMTSKIEDVHVKKVGEDLAFILYDEYLFIYTPHRAGFIRSFEHKNKLIKFLRSIFKKTDTRSYKFPYIKAGKTGYYYFTVQEMSILPYFMFIEDKKFSTFREMRNYIRDHKQDWLQHNSKKMLSSSGFQSLMERNEVYFSVPKSDRYWQENSSFVDPRASKLLRAYLGSKKAKKPLIK